MLSASLLTTYIELWLTTQGYYTFLTRPFPSVFPVDIRFTLVIIPIFTLFALWMMRALNGLSRYIFILLASSLAMLLEPIMEAAGWVAFSSSWHHVYSFIGYAAFLLLIRLIHTLASRLDEAKERP